MGVLNDKWSIEFVHLNSNTFFNLNCNFCSYYHFYEEPNLKNWNIIIMISALYLIKSFIYLLLNNLLKSSLVFYVWLKLLASKLKK